MMANSILKSFTMSCITCGLTVGARQHAIACDTCHRWNHRTCDIGTICSYLRNILGYRLMNNKRLSRVSQAAYCTTHDSVDKPEQSSQQFDVKILEYIVCPISKQPLRYEASTNELICDELNVAYPIQNGIPNLVPGDARMMSEDPPPSTDNQL